MRSTTYTLADWEEALPNLRWRNHYAAGPCPLCGGEDRFWISDTSEKVGFGCRHCLPNGKDKDRVRTLLRTVFGGRKGSGAGSTRQSTARNRAKSNPSGQRKDTQREFKAIRERIKPLDFTTSDHPARTYLITERMIAWTTLALATDIGWVYDRKRNDGSGLLTYAYRNAQQRVVGYAVEMLRADGTRQTRNGRVDKRFYGTRRGAIHTPIPLHHPTVKVRDTSQPRIAIMTEGEIDALTCAYLREDTHPHLTCFAMGGTNNLRWHRVFDQFDHVLLCKDTDPAGLRAGIHCAESFVDTATNFASCKPRFGKDINASLLQCHEDGMELDWYDIVVDHSDLPLAAA